MPPTLQQLCQQFVANGVVRNIFLRPNRGEDTIQVKSVHAVKGRGLLGDRATLRASALNKRDITLFQYEHLAVLAPWLKHDYLDAGLLRRNLVIEGLNLLSMRSPFKQQTLHWRIGASVLIEVTGPCEPCSKMELILGVGAYNVLRGHGGVTARIVQSGEIKIGDLVQLFQPTSNDLS